MLVKPKTSAEFIASESNGFRSRDEVIVTMNIADGALEAGAVLQKAGDKYVKLATPANAAAILMHPLDAVTANATDVATVAVVRDAEVTQSSLTYSSAAPADIVAANAAMAVFGIVARK